MIAIKYIKYRTRQFFGLYKFNIGDTVSISPKAHNNWQHISTPNNKVFFISDRNKLYPAGEGEGLLTGRLYYQLADSQTNMRNHKICVTKVYDAPEDTVKYLVKAFQSIDHRRRFIQEIELVPFKKTLLLEKV